MLYTYFYLHKKPLYTSIKGMPKHLGKKPTTTNEKNNVQIYDKTIKKKYTTSFDYYVFPRYHNRSA